MEVECDVQIYPPTKIEPVINLSKEQFNQSKVFTLLFLKIFFLQIMRTLAV